MIRIYLHYYLLLCIHLKVTACYTFLCFLLRRSCFSNKCFIYREGWDLSAWTPYPSSLHLPGCRPLFPRRRPIPVLFCIPHRARNRLVTGMHSYQRNECKFDGLLSVILVVTFWLIIRILVGPNWLLCFLKRSNGRCISGASIAELVARPDLV